MPSEEMKKRRFLNGFEETPQSLGIIQCYRKQPAGSSGILNQITTLLQSTKKKKAGRRAAVQQADPWPRAALHARPNYTGVTEEYVTKQTDLSKYRHRTEKQKRRTCSHAPGPKPGGERSARSSVGAESL